MVGFGGWKGLADGSKQQAALKNQPSSIGSRPPTVTVEAPGAASAVDSLPEPPVGFLGDGQDGGAEEPLLPAKDGEVAGAWKAYANTVCMMMGVGLLGYPATVAKGGWVMMAVIPVLVGMACYCARLLTDQLYVDVARGGAKIPGYPELGWRVGGWGGFLAAHASMKVVLFTVSGVMAYLGSSMTCSAYLACKYGHDWPNNLPENVDQDNLTKQIIQYFCLASLLPILTLPNLRELSTLAMFGTAATVAAGIAVIVMGGLDGMADGVTHTAAKGVHIGDGFGAIVLGLGGASTMPSIEKQMRAGAGKDAGELSVARPYKRVLVGVFATIGIAYMAVAFTGYYNYGDDVAGLILFSLPTRGAYLWINMVIFLSLTVNCFTTHSLIAMVLSEEFELKVHGVVQSRLTFTEHLCQKHTPTTLLFRMLIILWSFLVAFYVPNFLALCDLAGSLCVFTVYILPCVFALMLDRQRDVAEPGLGWPRIVWICVVIVVATIGFYFGFKSAVKEVHDAFKN